MRRQSDGRVIKDVGCVCMVLEHVQFNHLKMIFIQQKVWEIMWNQISYASYTSRFRPHTLQPLRSYTRR